MVRKKENFHANIRVLKDQRKAWHLLAHAALLGPGLGPIHPRLHSAVAPSIKLNLKVIGSYKEKYIYASVHTCLVKFLVRIILLD